LLPAVPLITYYSNYRLQLVMGSWNNLTIKEEDSTVDQECLSELDDL